MSKSGSELGATGRPFIAAALAVLCGLIALIAAPAQAQCVVPDMLTNGQTADATQVMANFNSAVSCINALPAGSANALQYNVGPGVLGGVGPLANGQLVIGSAGNPPQAANLIAGTGVTITNGPGSITIGASAVSGGGGMTPGQAFNPNGTLTPQAIDESRMIIPSSKLGNPKIPPGYSKWSTGSICPDPNKPNLKYQAHFYKNDVTGEPGVDPQSETEKIGTVLAKENRCPRVHPGASAGSSS